MNYLLNLINCIKEEVSPGEGKISGLYLWLMGKTKAKKRTQYNRIRVMLAERDLMNKEVAVALGVSEQTISKWVTNTTQPTIKQLFGLAAFLKTSPKDLLGDGKLTEDMITTDEPE